MACAFFEDELLADVGMFDVFFEIVSSYGNIGIV
jgi:Trk-type K+ transport system membrane component